MRRMLLLVTVAAMMAAVMAVAGPASATIHPIVESFDCANEQAFAHHPLGDPADPLGQTPGDVNPAGKPTGSGGFTALSNANPEAFFGHKLNFECGTAQGPK